MATINNNSYSSPKNINLKSGILRFDEVLSAAMDASTDVTLYTRGATPDLYFWNGTSETKLGSAGTGGAYTLNDCYDDGATITVDAGAVALTGSHATNNVFEIAYGGLGTGNMIDIQNDSSGSVGYDIIGTDDTWSFSTVGALVCVGLTNTSDITTTGAAIDWDLIDDNASALSIDASGKAGILAIVTTNASEAVTMSGLLTLAGSAGSTIVTLTAGDMVLSEGSIAVTDDDNATTLSITNDGATTIGNAADNGVVQIICDTLTSGTLLHLSATEGTLDGGYYLKCWDETSDAAVFSVGENGAVTIAGSAEDTDALTLTAGDLTLTDGALVITAGAFTYTAGDMAMSDGSLAITDADNATTFSVINATATTASVTSVTANALTTGTGLTITSTGTIITTGELLSLVGNSATTCTGLLRISGTALTDGFCAEFTGGGASASATGGVLNLDAGAATDGSVLKITTTGIYAGTVGVVDINAASATTGVIVDVTVTALTTGTILKLSSNTTATGKYIDCYDGTATDFSVGRYGATIIAGNAAATDALTITAGDATLTSGHLVLTAGNATLTDGDIVLTANGSKITFTGTGANGGVLSNLKNASPTGLSGDQKDIEIDIGGTPYYFTTYPTKA